MRSLACDRCGGTENSNFGSKMNAKPRGWSRVTVDVKEAKTIKTVSFDLCAVCTKDLLKPVTQ